MIIDFTDKERVTISNIATTQELSEENVIRQALRTYQLIQNGRAKLMIEPTLSKLPPHAVQPVTVQHQYALIAGKSEKFSSIKEKFDALVERWENHNAGRSTTDFEQLSYLQIIGMGPEVIPFLLEKLRGGDGDYIYALKCISGEQAETPEMCGDAKRVIDAWLKWGETKGYIRSVSNTEKIFTESLAKWRKDTEMISNITQTLLHPSHLRIIGLGKDALLLIFKDMTENNSASWFPALEAITGINPVLPHNNNNYRLIREDWLNWAKENGYLEETK